MPGFSLGRALAGTSVFPKLGPKTDAIEPQITGWDKGLLGGMAVPGKTKVSGGKIKIKHDKKNKPGANGANPTFHGLDPQEFELEVYMWTDKQMDDFLSLCGKILPKEQAPPKEPFILDHPDILHFGMTFKVYVLGASAIEREGVTGRKCKLYLLHWLKPSGKSKTHTPVKPASSIREGAQSREPAKKNPPPTAPIQSIGAPPPNFTPAR